MSQRGWKFDWKTWKDIDIGTELEAVNKQVEEQAQAAAKAAEAAAEAEALAAHNALV